MEYTFAETTVDGNGALSMLNLLQKMHPKVLRSVYLSTFEPVNLVIPLNYHWKLRHQPSFVLTDKPPSVLLDCGVKLFPFSVQNERIFLDFKHLCHLPFLENFPSCPCRQEVHVFPCYHLRTLAVFLGWHSQSSGLMVYIHR